MPRTTEETLEFINSEIERLQRKKWYVGVKDFDDCNVQIGTLWTVKLFILRKEK